MGNAGQGISSSGFLAVIWTLTAVTTVLFIGRLLIRRILVKRFHLDDLFGAIAWIFTTTVVILATVVNPFNYESGAIVVGEAPTPPLDELVQLTIALRMWNVVCEVLFWTALYCVKLSFMFLYRLIFRNHHKSRHPWFVITIYVVISYGISLIGVIGQCGDAGNLFLYEECMTPDVRALDLDLIIVQYFFNVTSDLAIFIFPMPIIWRLRMPAKQKLALSGISCLALITVAFDTARTVKLFTEDFTLTNLYSYLELIIAVLTGMLPSYRFLVSPTEQDRQYRRLFWSRVTLRRSTDSSGIPMDIIGRQHADQPQGATDDGGVSRANNPFTDPQQVTTGTQA